MGLQLFRQLRRDLFLLSQQMGDDDQHEVDEKDGRLHYVLFRLGQAFSRIPASAFQEKVMDAAIQFPVKLAEVLAAVSLGDAVLLSLVIVITGDLAVLAFASTQLLQRGLAVDIPGRNQGHDLRVGEIVGPPKSFLGREALLQRKLDRTGRRWRRHSVVATRP